MLLTEMTRCDCCAVGRTAIVSSVQTAGRSRTVQLSTVLWPRRLTDCNRARDARQQSRVEGDRVVVR